MSLRVLLADESDTIKKVFQLALQDLNAEVKSVHSGLDVLDVANSFQPTIIFADILLQKRNGYEICSEIKHSNTLKNIPVILMWSSFMELDQELYKKSLANDQLEKPFDADHLREIVKKHTEAADVNPLAQFLNFPKSISAKASPPQDPNDSSFSLELDKESPLLSQETAPQTPLAESDLDEDTSEFNLSSLLEDNPPVTDAPTPAPSETLSSAPSLTKKSFFEDLLHQEEKTKNQDAWAAKDLSQFKISEDKSDDLDKFEALNLGQPTNPNIISDEKTDDLSQVVDTLKKESFSLPNLYAETPASASPSFKLEQTGKEKTPAATESKKVATAVGLSDSEIEAIVRAHTEEIIKSQIKDSLLNILEKIVREELNKVMEEELRLRQDIDSET